MEDGQRSTTARNKKQLAVVRPRNISAVSGVHWYRQTILRTYHNRKCRMSNVFSLVHALKYFETRWLLPCKNGKQIQLCSTSAHCSNGEMDSSVFRLEQKGLRHCCKWIRAAPPKGALSAAWFALESAPPARRPTDLDRPTDRPTDRPGAASHWPGQISERLGDDAGKCVEEIFGQIVQRNFEKFHPHGNFEEVWGANFAPWERRGIA